ncbi:hypothetical protein BH09VER1_BH09VER1_13720 [soil metagenome]
MWRLPLFALLAVASASGAALEKPFHTVFSVKDLPSFGAEGAEAGKLAVSLPALNTPEGSLPGIRIQCSAAASNPRNAQIVASVPVGVDSGDTLWIRFLMRTTASEQESGEGRVQVVFENAGNFEKSLQYSASTGRAWKEVMVPFAAKGTTEARGTRLCLRLGYQRQDLEIAGLEIRDYGRGVAVADLPLSKQEFNYDGMKADAPWRAEADERIDKLRKANLVINVVDASGKPVEGATVDIVQTKHEYLFGSAVNAAIVASQDGEESQKYREAIAQDFNVVTFENDLKWARWMQDRETPLAAARWCQRSGITLRGHTLVWASWRKLPSFMKDLSAKSPELRDQVMRHIQDEATALGPLAAIWDVLNEPFDNHDLMDRFGDGFIVDCFAAARRAAPAARLFINDYGIVSDRGLDHNHQDNYEKNIRFLVDHQAPLQGIGIQGHFGQELTAPVRILEILDRFGSFHLPIQMTEFSLQIEDRKIGAAYLRDVLTVFFSHPSTDGFVLWGFKDGPGGFKQFATLYEEQWQLTPCGQVWRDLVYGKWWTKEQLQTSASGSAELRGFRGEYQVTAKHGDSTASTTLKLGAEGAEGHLQLGE